jgi:pyridoxal phosphate enzyme (YggS family)
MDIRKNIEIVKYKVAESAEKAGKKPEEIRIVAVGKTFPAEILLEAKEGGLREFGENKVQELVEKMNALGKEVSWHMIGHLQKNKAKYIVGAVDLIHSLDSFDLALQIDKTAEKCGCIQDVLVQVNISGEETKFGLRPEDVLNFLKEVSMLERIRVRGLMTIGPNTDDKNLIRESFRRMHSLYIDMKDKKLDNIKMDILSMGMSKDFEIAIQEGANMVRIGSAIFGNRMYR